MKKHIYKIKQKVWLYSGVMASWHFVSIGTQISKEIKIGYPFIGRRGFGSVPVIVTVGKTSWKTSIFPDNKRKTYILPLKKEIRIKENISPNKILSFTLEVLT